MLQAINAIVCQRLTQTAVEVLAKNRIERLINKGGFATPRHTRYSNHLTKRERDIYVLEVIASTTAEGKVIGA